jgi:hypothetical protein
MNRRPRHFKSIGRRLFPEHLQVEGWLLLIAALLLTLTRCLGPDEPLPPRSSTLVMLERKFKDPRAQQLAIAAEQGDAAEVRRLMREEHVNPDQFFSADGDGLPLLAWPILTRSVKGLRAMLENGANPNVYLDFRTEQGEIRHRPNAMVHAARNADPAYLKLLLEHGGDPNTRDDLNESLLQIPMYQGRRIFGGDPSDWDKWKRLQLLIEHGADVKVFLAERWPVLFDYANRGQFDKVYWLLEHGVSPVSEWASIAALTPTAVFHQAIHDIYEYPVKTKAGKEWQRKCQDWLMRHGYPPPPKSVHDDAPDSPANMIPRGLTQALTRKR